MRNTFLRLFLTACSFGLVVAAVCAPGVAMADPSCPDGQSLFNGNCLTVQTTDVSTKAKLPTLGNNLFLFNLPVQNFGFMGLKGTITLATKATGTFTEELLEIGWAPTCTAGSFSAPTYDDISQYAPSPNYISAYIAKTDSTGKVTLSIDYTLPTPVAMAGCFMVYLGADSWQPTGAAAPTVTMTNTLAARYIDTSGSLSSAAVLDEGQASGGEFCVGYCDKDFNAHTDTPTNTYLTVTQLSISENLLALVGSISNSPFVADGRFGAVTGDWSTEDIFYLDPGCSKSKPGFSGAVADTFNPPSGAVTLYDFKQAGTDTSAKQGMVYQPVNRQVNAGDCIGHIFSAASNGVIDMESQVSTFYIPTSSLSDTSTSTDTSTDSSTDTSTDTSTGVKVKLQPLFRAYNPTTGDHNYVNKAKTALAPGYRNEGWDFTILADGATLKNVATLYDCTLDNGHHFLSVDSACEGSGATAVDLGMVRTVKNPGNQPLYRYFNNQGDHYATTDPSAAPSGYVQEGILGYIPLKKGSGSATATNTDTSTDTSSSSSTSSDTSSDTSSATSTSSSSSTSTATNTNSATSVTTTTVISSGTNTDTATTTATIDSTTIQPLNGVKFE